MNQNYKKVYLQHNNAVSPPCMHTSKLTSSVVPFSAKIEYIRLGEMWRSELEKFLIDQNFIFESTFEFIDIELRFCILIDDSHSEL